MLKYQDFYRRFGVRKEEALKSFTYPSTKGFELPRESVYHSLPLNATDRSVDPNDLLLATHQGDFYCVHATELLETQGLPTKVSGLAPQTLIKDLEKQNRKLRRVRQTDVVYNNPKALLIYNYALLQTLYRYRPNFLNPWQRWYNIYATMWRTISQVANESTRQHYVKVELPLSIPSITDLNRAAKGLNRDLMEVFNTPALMQLLDLWKWAGGEASALDLLDPSVTERVNLVFVEGNRVGIVNLFKLREWRGLEGTEEDDETLEDNAFIRELEARFRKGAIANSKEPTTTKPHAKVNIFQRKLLMFVVRMAKLRTVVTDGAEQLPFETTPLKNAGSPGPNESIALFDETSELPVTEVEEGDDFTAQVDEFNAQAPGQREVGGEVVTPDVSVNTTDIPTDDQLLDDSLFVVHAQDTTGVGEVSTVANDVDVLAAPEIGVVSRAQELFERGVLSVAEYRRFEKLAGRYKEIPNPFDEFNESLADLATITKEHLALDQEACTLENIPGVDDPSLLKSTLLQFDSKYIREVLHRDIANSVLAAQRAGVAVTDLKVDRVVDAVNRYDEYTVRLTPVGGEPSTVRFTIPVIEDDGSWVADGARYMLRKQRGDAPIHKVSPSRVALTSYDSKIFIQRSDKVVNNYDEWLQNKIITAQMSGAGTVKNVHYRSGALRLLKGGLPRQYTGLASRFTAIETETWQLTFTPETLEKDFGADIVSFLAKQGLVPFGVTGENRASILAMDENGALYTYENRQLLSYGDVGTLFGIDLARAPLELLEYKVAGKAMPVGVALCYLLGLDRVLKDIGTTPRRVQKGARLALGADEFALRFFDEALVFTKLDRKATLLFSGFQQFSKQIANYPVNEFNKKDVYLNVIDGRGLGLRQLNALADQNIFFIDPITLGLLKELNEPTTYTGLLYRATELLLNDYVPVADDRYRGYERIAAAVYRELTGAIKAYRRRPLTSKASVDLNPNAVWMAIQTDPANGLVEDSNPISYLKEQEAVTFGGTGGRSSRSMVRSTRRYNPRDFGIISEATKDSSDVAISTYFSANPRLTSLRGTVEPADYEQYEMSSVISTSALCAPSALNDDAKRVNFISIQNGSTVASVSNRPMPLRTGYESIIAHRVGKLYAFSSKQPGKVLEVSKRHILIEYTDGSKDSCELGTRFGVVSGSTIPHTIVTDLKPGDTFNRTEILAWNDGFYCRDRFNKRQVLAKQGTLVKVAIVDNSDTHEDSSAISSKLANRMATHRTETRVLTLSFDQKISNLVKVGDVLKSDDKLCIIEDPLTANLGLFDELSDDTLTLMSANTPKADYAGVVERIEVFYRGDKEDMSETLREVADYYDSERRKVAKALRNETAYTGEVFDRVRIGGNVLEYGNLCIKVYISEPLGMVAGDKVVFANQMKSVVGRVFTGRHETESGVEYDAMFSNSSFFNRIVESPYKWGTTNTLLLFAAKRVAQIYRGK